MFPLSRSRPSPPSDIPCVAEKLLCVDSEHSAGMRDGTTPLPLTGSRGERGHFIKKQNKLAFHTMDAVNLLLHQGTLRLLKLSNSMCLRVADMLRPESTWVEWLGGHLSLQGRCSPSLSPATKAHTHPSHRWKSQARGTSGWGESQVFPVLSKPETHKCRKRKQTLSLVPSGNEFPQKSLTDLLVVALDTTGHKRALQPCTLVSTGFSPTGEIIS